MKSRRTPLGIMIIWCALGVASPLAFGQDRDRTESGSPARDENRVYEVRSRTRVKLGGVSMGVGYACYLSPYIYQSSIYPGYNCDFAGYPWCTYPRLWSPMDYPGMLPGFAYREGKGEVRLESTEKEAEVYINGAYAGIVRDLRNVWLDPGVYDLELSREG